MGNKFKILLGSDIISHVVSTNDHKIKYRTVHRQKVIAANEENIEKLIADEGVGLQNAATVNLRSKSRRKFL